MADTIEQDADQVFEQLTGVKPTIAALLLGQPNRLGFDQHIEIGDFITEFRDSGDHLAHRTLPRNMALTQAIDTAIRSVEEADGEYVSWRILRCVASSDERERWASK